MKFGRAEFEVAGAEGEHDVDFFLLGNGEGVYNVWEHVKQGVDWDVAEKAKPGQRFYELAHISWTHGAENSVEVLCRALFGTEDQ